MGFCGSKPVLVYPYTARLSLYVALRYSKVIVPREFISWEHNESGSYEVHLPIYMPHFIHRVTRRDCTVFANHILLDGESNPYVADFGFLVELLMKYGSNGVVSVAGAMALAGTWDYLAPDFSTGS